MKNFKRYKTFQVKHKKDSSYSYIVELFFARQTYFFIYEENHNITS